MCVRLLLSTLVLMLLSGCAGETDPAATPSAPEEASHTVSWTLTPRGSQELNFRMEEGATVSYGISTSAPVAWDLHSHDEAGTVTTHRSGEGREATGHFEAPASGTYSIFVRATGSTTVAEVSLQGAFEVVG